MFILTRTAIQWFGSLPLPGGLHVDSAFCNWSQLPFTPVPNALGAVSPEDVIAVADFGAAHAGNLIMSMHLLAIGCASGVFTRRVHGRAACTFTKSFTQTHTLVVVIR